MNEGQVNQVISHFMSQVKYEDVMNVGFMKPVEMALRTHKNDKDVPNNTLPQGMLYAHKEGGITQNKYTLHPVQEVNPEASLQELRQSHQDNYISLLKKPEGTELAICVCMYSEDKPMLKRTLEGIADNIDLLIQRGMAPDDIYVNVIIDGIQKVDPSLFTYFQDLQRQSQIFLEEDEQNNIRKKYHQQMVDTEVNESCLNYSRFLFQKEEFQDRIQRKFINVREKYDQVDKIRKQVQNIQKQRNSANQNLKIILNKIITQQKNALQAMAEEGGYDPDQFPVTEESIMQELTESERQANQYIAARDQLAYFMAYRLPTTSLSQNVLHRLREEEQYEKVDRSTRSSQTQLSGSLLDKSNPLKDSSSGITKRRSKKYVNLIFCIKYKNSGKLSSHNWFFNGVANELKPRYSILLDVGLRPYPQSLFKMYHYMKKRPHIGGVCGYMSLKAQKVEDQQMHKEEDLDWLTNFCLHFVDIQRAQQIQYHFAHLIDKPFESIFKFIHVLPGAFSGYSMQALRPVDRKDALLREYFKSIDDKLKTNKVVPCSFSAGQAVMRVLIPKFIWKLFSPVDPDSQEQVLYNENIYLAEDRILCMGIHKNEKQIIFMPDAYAEVDPIKTVNGLMGQRKRWINGSNFAFEKVQRQMDQYQSQKNKWVDRFLKLQIFYLNFSNFLVYFAPAILLFTFHLTMQAFRQQVLKDLFNITVQQGAGSIIYNTFVSIMDFLYALMFFGVVFFSVHLTHGNKRYIYYAYLFSTLYGVMSVMTFVVILVDIIKGFVGSDSYIQSTYEQQLQEHIGDAIILVDLLRYFILSSMLFYIFPLVLYGVFFCRIKYFWQIITGTLSFLFYSPSYLNLLNIYALCRIDDISWGTKGLDASVGGKNAMMKDTWKIVKMMDVAKFFFWNVIAGTLFIVFDSYLIIKFFVTLVLLMVFTFIQIIKILIGMAYLIKYKCITAKKNQAAVEGITPEATATQQNGGVPAQMKMHIFNVVDRFQEQIRTDIQFAFQFAAQQKEEEEMMEQEGQGEPVAQPQKEGDRLMSVEPRQSRMSRQVMQAFQTNKFQNIRKANEMKRDYYPDAKRNPIKEENQSGNIEMHLLHRKFQQQIISKNADPLDRQAASKRISRLRTTFMNNLQSKRFM